MDAKTSKLISTVKKLIIFVLGLPLLLLAYHTLARIIRHFYKFPIPEFLTPLIDNPWRRRIQPPDQMPIRHGLQPRMTVLEVGPGNGRYTVATARYLGDQGRLIAIDIEPKVIERVQQAAQTAGASNVEARVGNVHQLDFDNNTFDAIYMIAVIGEIPRPECAMAEFCRVLRPGGTLAFSELLMDPDYPLAQTLTRWASSAGFAVKNKVGNLWAYTLVFEKLQST
ncbi:MAG: class I SAM-dependent methyltransferase [Anaerolineae bacterium]|nr:class I SAM-dependent methyltransferase [Anaerolineae bacterium]